MSLSVDETQFGESWLFYGCRHKDQDFLYRFFDDITTIIKQLILSVKITVRECTQWMTEWNGWLGQ